MAKKKSAKSVKAASVRPKTSPYTSQPTTVYFGVDCQRYYVPDDLLKKLENLPPSDPWTGIEMHFKDVDADTGHVLIHFLHTGTYQTLDDIKTEQVDGSENDIVISEFQKAMRALEAATKHGLSGLQQLAQTEMERSGANMNLYSTVRAISEDCVTGPLGENTWLRDYVLQKVRSTFEQNIETFSEPDFFDGIPSPTLTKILARNVVSLYSEKVSNLQTEKLASGKPPASEGAYPESVGKVGAFDDLSATGEPHTLNNGKISTPEAAPPEPAVQLDKKSKKLKKAAMLQKIAEHAEANAAKVDALELTSAQTIPASVTTDVVVEPEEIKVEEQAQQVSQAPVPGPSTELPMSSLSAVENINPISSSTPLEKKKQKKVRSSTTSPELTPVPKSEPVSDAPSPAAVQGLDKRQVKLLKKQKREEEKRKLPIEEDPEHSKHEQEEKEHLRMLEEEPLVQTTIEEPLDMKASEAVDIDATAAPETKKKKKKKYGWSDGIEAVVSLEKAKEKKDASLNLDTAVPSPPELEQEPQLATGPSPIETERPSEVIAAPEVESKQNETEFSDWGYSSKQANKKKGLSRDLDTALSPPPEARPLSEEESLPKLTTEPPPAETDWTTWSSGWGGISTSSTKKKKKKKKNVIATYNDPTPEPEAVPGSDLIEPNVLVEDASKAHPTAEESATLETDDCPLRMQHLSDGHGWKTCESCENYMRGWALKLHSGGHVGVHSFSAAT